MQVKETQTLTIGDINIKATFSDIAAKATSSVMVESEGTVLLVTVVASQHDSDKDYFPLNVEFEERFYAVGGILGGRFTRREGKPSLNATLTARIIDRTIRPLFPEGCRKDIQVICTLLSLGKQDPSVLGVLGASLALGTSSIQWNGPVSAVQISKTTDGWQPFVSSSTERSAELLLCGKGDIITMIEMEGKQIEEAEIMEASKSAQKIIKDIEKFQDGIIKKIGSKKEDIKAPTVSLEVKELFKEHIQPHLDDAIFGDAVSIYELEERWNAVVAEHCTEDIYIAKNLFHETVNTILHNEALDNKKRADGRAFDEVRPLYAQAGGVSDGLHGSGLFYRGKTHVLGVLTLGGPEDALLSDNVAHRDTEEYFMHHYNFPPYSTGEVGRVGSPKRRELGHGALAEKAIRQIIPSQDTFPYTIRLVSECMASHGSTSMASVCASTIALMDGGVPIVAPVAGIAIGLMQRGKDYVVLTDIQGPEDHYGDMDLKIAGTTTGVTAMQMDVKIDGITLPILEEALDKAKAARLHILEVIAKEIAEPRKELHTTVPIVTKIHIPVDAIGLVIGGGGKTIRSLREDTGVKEIQIEDDGEVTISGEKDAVEQAKTRIEDMTKTVEVGEELDVTIERITDFGAFAAINPNTDGLIHISEFAPVHINSAADLVAIGDVVPVVVKEKSHDRISLSIKDRDPDYFASYIANLPKKKPPMNPRSTTNPRFKRGGPPRRPTDRNRRRPR